MLIEKYTSFDEYLLDSTKEFDPFKCFKNLEYLKGLESANEDDPFLMERQLPDMHSIDLSIPQMEFFQLEDKFPLFVAGLGSGKSLTLALCAVADIINFPGSDVAVYAPTYDLLKLILIPFIAELFEDGGYNFKYNGSEHIFYVEDHGRVICRSLDNPVRIVGYETFRAHCDEIDILTEEKAELSWNKIIARNRQKVYILNDNGKRICAVDKNGELQLDDQGNQKYKMHLNRVSAYTTPEGWKFAYKRWVEKKEKGYVYVTASTYSNEHNLPDDYIDSLKRSYPAELVEAYIEGKFTNLTSGRVYRNFDRKLNKSNQSVLPQDILSIGMDFNIEHGAAVVFVTRKNKKTGIEEEHAVDEIFDSFDTDDTIRIVKERYPNHLTIEIYPDATGKKRSSSSAGVNTKGEATKTDIYKLKQADFMVVVNRSNPYIKDRISAVNAMILNGEGVRKFFINIKKCPNYVKTLEQQVYDKNGLPDKSSGLDHLGDSGGYCIVKKYPPLKLTSGFILRG